MWKSELSQGTRIREDKVTHVYKLQILNMRTSTKAAYLFVAYFMTRFVPEIT